MAATEVTGDVAATPASEPWAFAVPMFTTMPLSSASQAPSPSGVTLKPATGDVKRTGDVGARAGRRRRS